MVDFVVLAVFRLTLQTEVGGNIEHFDPCLEQRNGKLGGKSVGKREDGGVTVGGDLLGFRSDK